MVFDPLTPREIELHRERVLAEIARIRRQPKGPEVSIEQVEALFNKAAKVSNKANVLARAIAREASKYFIPVHPDATDTRAAVRRTSADSPDGLKISFDLFRDAIEYTLRQKKEMEPHVILSQSIEPGAVFDKKMKKIRAKIRLSAGGPEPDDNYLELLVSQFIILYLTHFLLKSFDNLFDIQPVAATLEPKTTDEVTTAEILVQVLIGVAVQLLIMGVNEAMMEDALERTATIPKGYKAKDIVRMAKAQERTKAHDLAEAYRSLSDYEVILQYAFEYLEKTIEPGYEMWIAYVDSVRIRGIAQNTWVYAPHYSPVHALKSMKIPGLPASASESDKINRDLLLKNYLLESLAPMSSLAYSARSQVLDSSNDKLNLIAQILSNDFAIGLACCLGVKMGKVNPKVLKYMKALMEGMMRANGFNIRRSLQALHDGMVHPNFAEIIAQEAMHQIDKVFNKITKKLLGLFGPSWEPLLCCPLLGEMIQATLDGLTTLESQMLGAATIFSSKAIDAVGMGTKDMERRYEVFYENRTLRKIVLILDAVIRAADSMDQCSKDGSGAPLPEPIRSALALPTITIEADEKKNYFTDAVPRELSNGKLIPSVGDEISTLYSSAFQSGIDRIAGAHTCGAPASGDAVLKAVRDLAPPPSAGDDGSVRSAG